MMLTFHCVAACLSALCLIFLASSATAADDRRVLVFGDSNSWGWKPVAEGRPTSRYDDAERWPGILESRLGATTTVVVDALSGRTVDTAYEGTVGTLNGAAFDGAAALPAAIARELPLDLVIVMLGTNDARSDLARDPADVAAGMCRIAEIVRSSAGGVFTTYPAPDLLVVVPPIIGDTSRTPISGVTVDATARSDAIGNAIASAAARCDYEAFDAREIIEIRTIDGVHLSSRDHERLGLMLAPLVTQMLERKWQ